MEEQGNACYDMRHYDIKVSTQIMNLILTGLSCTP